jgi:hypothetical protein
MQPGPLIVLDMEALAPCPGLPSVRNPTILMQVFYSEDRFLPLVPNPSVRRSPGTPSRGFISIRPLGFFVSVTQRGTLQAGNGLGADHRSGVAFVAVGVTGLPRTAW